MNFFNDNPAIKFQLSHPLMQKIVALKERICADIIAPNAESVDHDGPQVENSRVIYARGTQENHDALKQAGVYGITLPRQYGGLNFPMVAYVMSGEMVSR